jgi:hypothetical protein
MTPDAATFAAIAASLVGASPASLSWVCAPTATGAGSAAAAQPPLGEQRLARLELAIDAIAVEVERIGEGPRFLTRLHVGAGRVARAGRASRGADGGAS